MTGREVEQLDAVNFYRENGYPEISPEQFVYWGDYLGDLLMDPKQVHTEKYGLSYLEQCFRAETDGNIRYFDQGRLAAVEIPQDIQEKRCVHYYNEHGEKEYEKTFWKGRLNRIYYFDTVGKTARKLSLFYAANGFCFMRIVEEKRKQWDTKEIYVFSEKDHAVYSFSEWNEVRQYLYFNYIKNCQEKRIFCLCDELATFHNGLSQLLSIGEKEIYRIGILHVSGLYGTCEWNSQMNRWIAEQVGNKITPDVDALCFLTRQAKECYQKRWGGRDIFYHIANPIAVPAKVEAYSRRNRQRVVYIGRLKEMDKQISHIIKAFQKVSQQVLDAELYIFGAGEDEGMYRDLIKEMALSNVYLMPFTNDVAGELQKSALAVVTSTREAFCLSLAEALANGTPVVSYDFKFGARDLIQNGKNGLIVEQNDIEALADAVTELLRDPERMEAMSGAARELIQETSEERFLEKWIDLLNDVVEKHASRTVIQAVKLELETCVLNVSQRMLTIRGSYTIEGRIPEQAEGKERFYLRVYHPDKSDYTVSDVLAEKIEKGVYRICAELPFTGREISLCLEWNNSFAESPLSI